MFSFIFFKEPSPVKDSSFTSNTTSENIRQKLEQCKAVITGQEAIIQVFLKIQKDFVKIIFTSVIVYLSM